MRRVKITISAMWPGSISFGGIFGGVVAVNEVDETVFDDVDDDGVCVTEAGVVELSGLVQFDVGRSVGSSKTSQGGVAKFISGLG